MITNVGVAWKVYEKQSAVARSRYDLVVLSVGAGVKFEISSPSAAFNFPRRMRPMRYPALAPWSPARHKGASVWQELES
jgi:hypothetical protein